MELVLKYARQGHLAFIYLEKKIFIYIYIYTVLPKY